MNEINLMLKLFLLSTVYEVLSDASKRKQYDQFGESAFNNGGPQQQGSHFNFNDFFRDFDGAFHSHHQGRKPKNTFRFNSHGSSHSFGDLFDDDDDDFMNGDMFGSRMNFGGFGDGFGDFENFGSHVRQSSSRSRSHSHSSETPIKFCCCLELRNIVQQARQPSCSAPQPSCSAPQPSCSAPQPSCSADQPFFWPLSIIGRKIYGLATFFSKFLLHKNLWPQIWL